MSRAVERPNRYFSFLRRLRAEGRSNMYGAVPYLAAAFGIDRNESFRIVCEWIDAQEAVAGDSAVPRTAAPGTRTGAPTLFDTVPAPAVASQAAPGDRLEGRSARSRKRDVGAKPPVPVKQRSSSQRGSRTEEPRTRARKKSPPASDSRAA